jgi:hypothetical protein
MSKRLVQDMDKVEKTEEHAHRRFISWKQEHDAKTRLQAAQAMAESARKQIMWDKREMESDTAQKQAFAAWLRQKSQQQGQAFSRRHLGKNRSRWVAGMTEDSKTKLKNDADATTRLYQDLDIDPVSEQGLLDAIKRGVVVGSQRMPLLQQLYGKHQKEWGWDGRALGEADRRTFMFGGIVATCAGGVLEPFVEASNIHLPKVKSKICVAARSAGVQDLLTASIRAERS